MCTTKADGPGAAKASATLPLEATLHSSASAVAWPHSLLGGQTAKTSDVSESIDHGLHPWGSYQQLIRVTRAGLLAPRAR